MEPRGEGIGESVAVEGGKRRSAVTVALATELPTQEADVVAVFVESFPQQRIGEVKRVDDPPLPPERILDHHRHHPPAVVALEVP